MRKASPPHSPGMKRFIEHGAAFSFPVQQPACGPLVKEHYKSNNYTLNWITSEGLLAPYACFFIETIKKCREEAMDPSDYHLAEILLLESQLKVLPDSGMNNIPVQLDFLLTDAFNRYAIHQYAGRVHTAKYNKDWSLHVSEISPLDSLVKILHGASIQSVLNAFTCPHPQYQRLRKLLMMYRDSSGTEREMARICVNMERWRWLPRKMPERYISANIPGFELIVNDHGRDTLKMKIIAGKIQQPTPIFDARLSYLVLNPWWEIPAGIARKELLPQIKANKHYLSRNHIRVFNISGTQEVDPAEMNWDTIRNSNFHFRLRQEPGPWNALGEIKFIFPNPHDVYFHDTPQRELFSKTNRAFSHGCIRIEKPVELAAYLLQKEPARIRNQINSKKSIALKLPSPVPVFICYHTCLADENHTITIAPDIYGYDMELEQLLNPAGLHARHPLITNR